MKKIIINNGIVANDTNNGNKILSKYQTKIYFIILKSKLKIFLINNENGLHPLNILFISVTLSVFHLEMSGNFDNEEQ